MIIYQMKFYWLFFEGLIIVKLLLKQKMIGLKMCAFLFSSSNDYNKTGLFVTSNN